MKKLFALLLLFACSAANAQFTPGQVLTAAQLNAALAAPTITNGTITGLTVPLSATLGGLGIGSPTANAVLVGNGSSAVQTVGPGTTGQMLIGMTGSAPVWGNNPALIGATVDNSCIGCTTPAAVNATSLSATGTITVPSGSIADSALAAQAANTVLANTGAAIGSPTASSLPTCSTSSSALLYTSGTGFSCNTSINAVTLGGATFSAPGSIGSGTAGSGSFTTLSASGTVSGAGFSTYLASPPAIGSTTPAAGSFTTLSATGAITPSQTAGITGTTTNNDANAGSVGEFPSPTNLSGVSLTSGTAANAASIPLTAGDWEISGSVRFNPGGSATTSNMTAGISTTSATFGGLGSLNAVLIPFSSVSGGNSIMSTPTVRIKLPTATTVYLVGLCTFSASTMTMDGFIRARRPR